jgi:hypothetical protein
VSHTWVCRRCRKAIDANDLLAKRFVLEHEGCRTTIVLGGFEHPWRALLCYRKMGPSEQAFAGYKPAYNDIERLALSLEEE